MDFTVDIPDVAPPSVLREGKKLLLCLPWYKTASPLTTFCMMALADRTKMGISLGFGDAFIAHSRNKLATQFVNSSLEWMFTVDDDMILPFGDANWFRGNTGFKKFTDFYAGMHTIDRLQSHGKTLIGVTYFGRWREGLPIFAEGKASDLELRRNGPRNEIRPTQWIGTGGLLIHRSVFLAIEENFPHLSRAANNGTGQWFTSSEHDLKKAFDQIRDVLEDTLRSEPGRIAEALKIWYAGDAKARAVSNLGVGEDVIFCRRAAQSGHQPYVDLGCWAGHVGNCVYPILP
jgi:hypothetical protein